MTDPLEGLALPHDPEMPDAGFAARLRSRVEAIEAREFSGNSTGEARKPLNSRSRHLGEARFRAAPRDDRANQSQEEEAETMTTRMIPYLSVTDSLAAMEFYAEVFGAEPYGELVEMDDGRVGHAMMTIGDELLYMADEFPEMNILSPTSRGGGTVALVINVDDCDAVYQHALDAGAAGERPPSNGHGQRSGWFADPWGHRWSPTSAEKPGIP